jgi:sterol desaturase/sphingolipid hydroxylase (fatty acid hydroxylase superfamily)
MWHEAQVLLLALPQRVAGLSVALLLAGLVFVAAERWFPLHPVPIAQRKNWLADVGYYYLGSIIPSFVMLLVVPLAVMLLRPLSPMPWHPWMAGLGATTAFVASAVMSEVAYYWAHRFAHEVPLLWRFHAIHHSPAHVDWLVNTRGHPLDLSFMRAFIMVCMLVLGFGQRGAAQLAGAATLYSLWMANWGFFVHANIRLRLGWFEYVLSSPAFHHWHHVKGDPALVDKNYAATMPWVDMLFGSFYLPRKEWPQQYGIDDELAPGLWGQLINPLRGRRVRQIGLKAWGREPREGEANT